MKSLYFVLPCGSVFRDKKIPQKYDLSPPFLKESSEFSKQYFVNLHEKVASYGNYNYAGARNVLLHSKLRVDKFRQILPESFEDIAILKYMQFGFPIGLFDN